MLTGGDEKKEEKPKVEAKVEKEKIKKEAKEIVAENTNIN